MGATNSTKVPSTSGKPNPKIPNNICVDFFEKTNLEIKGLSVFIYGKFLKRMGCEIVNAGEDWDVEYLKKIKLSYKPHLIKKSYLLEKV